MDSKIIKALERQGVNKTSLYIFKLNNTQAYNKMISQASISVDIAVKRFKDTIKKGVYHYV